MPTYRTGNPIGTASAKDLYDDAQDFDNLMLGPNAEYPDRRGVSRLSYAGFEALAKQAIEDAGYDVIGDYSEGILTIQNYNQAFTYQGEFYKLKAKVKVPYTTTGTTETSWANEYNNGNGNFIAIGDAILRQELAASNGFGKIGQVSTFASLREITPDFSGQSILLQAHQGGWAAQRVPEGGGIFDAVNQKLSDDGGFVAQVSNTWAWVRRKPKHEATLLDYGAITGESYDCATALLAMHSALGFAALAPGDFGLSTISDSTISTFNFHGAVANYGRTNLSRLHLIGTGSDTALEMKTAQVTNIGGFDLHCNSYAGIFYDNTAKIGGKFYNIEKMVIRQSGNVVFNMTDTLDTLLCQIYSYSCAGSILKGRWDNEVSLAWDHNTAIAIRDCNFNGSTGMHALDLPRVMQGRMDNVWFQDCDKPADLSQGQWDINTLCLENPSNPIYGKYARLNITAPDYIGDNAKIDYDKSDYDPSWDDGDLNNGSMPSWVTSGYEAGQLVINNKTIQLNGELTVKAQTPLYRLPDSSQDTWVYVGTLVLTSIGIEAELTFLGSNQFNAASTTPTDPRTSGQGGGRSVVRVQHKGTTEGLTVTWFNEGSGPVQDVMYSQPYNTDINIYVKQNAYTYKTGLFLKATDFNRLEQGATFQFTPYLSVVSDISSVSGLKDAPAFWGVNNGSTGAGVAMDLDSGRLLYHGALDSSGTKIPMVINGNLKYISFSDN